MSDTTKDIERVVDAVLACTGPVTQILDHMARSPQPLAPERAAGILRGLLCDALHPLAVDAPREELRVAARLLDAAADLIVGEIMLVPHAPAARARPTAAARLPGALSVAAASPPSRGADSGCRRAAWTSRQAAEILGR